MSKTQSRLSIEKQSPLDHMLSKKVQIISSDGRIFLGFLKGVDQTLNLILQNCEERIYSESEGVHVEKMGLYLIRGDNVVVIGEIDENVDKEVNFQEVKAKQLDPIWN